MSGRELRHLIDATASHRSAGFYRQLWSGESVFERLPRVAREDFLRTPLSRRRYKDARSFVKIVRTGAGAFLSEWSLEDLEHEPFAEVSKRPFVYMHDAHDAIEKSLWCYQRGFVPLIGESDPDIAAYAASKYRVDSVITDPAALLKIASKLHTISKSLEHITVIGASFDPSELMFARAFAKNVSLVFALPETGAIARADLQAEPKFEVVPDCIVERNGEDLVVTKLASLVTPVIKYDISRFSDVLRLA